MKRDKIIFWIATIIIFLFEGVMPALTWQTELAKEGIRHLGYPEYFGNALVAFKILGVLALVIPQIPKRMKEWAYAGFAFDFIFATISHVAVDGINFQSFFPLIVMAILVVSYIYYHKINTTGVNS
jgi:hypothetical protein